MSLLSEELLPLCSRTTCVMPGFMCRQHRRVLLGRQAVLPIRPLSSPGCHKLLISHSPHRARLTPTAFTPLSYPTTCTHLHLSHMLRHFIMCGNTGLCHRGVLYQVEESNTSWRTEALDLIFIPLMFFTCCIKRKTMFPLMLNRQGGGWTVDG